MTTTDQNVLDQEQPSWGAPTPPAGRGRWSGRKTAAVAGVAVAIAAVAGGTIYATSGSDATSTTAQGPGGAAQGGPGNAGGAGGPAMGGGSAALHGTYTVADDTGTGYHTELSQTGKVTAISATSITLVSTDDYTKTYTIDSGTVVQAMQSTSAGGPGSTSSSTLTTSDVATGDQVSVTAAADGTTATVDTITEQT